MALGTRERAHSKSSDKTTEEPGGLVNSKVLVQSEPQPVPGLLERPEAAPSLSPREPE